MQDVTNAMIYEDSTQFKAMINNAKLRGNSSLSCLYQEEKIENFSYTASC